MSTHNIGFNNELTKNIFLLSLNFSSGGYYVYIETSSPRNSGDKARLLGPAVNGNGQPMCFTFWYNMFGDHVAALNILTKKGSTLSSPIWTKSGQQGNTWKQAQVQFLTSGATQVRPKMSLVTTNPVVGVSDQVRYKHGCTATEEG